MTASKHLENEHLLDEEFVPVPQGFFDRHPSEPWLSSFDEYKSMYRESIEEPSKFFGKMAKENLSWFKEFTVAKYPEAPLFKENGGEPSQWFIDGTLNASFNCIDRWAAKDPNKTAIIYEADEPDEGRKVTYGELLKDVCKLAQVLIGLGVKKGDTVAVYLPMIPEVVVTLMAINRIGAIHSVVFAGFSSVSLRDRIIDADSRIVITTDESKRGGKTIQTKKIVDDALTGCPDVEHVLVYKRTGNNQIPWTFGRDLWWHEELAKYKNYYPATPMNSEDTLFLLYTSGSTGKPKGVQHTTAGYLLGAMLTTKYVFDVHPEDTIFTAGDVGWITGHTYSVYGPLLNGATTVIFEGTPAYPSFSRYWEIVDKYHVNQFYAAPTALRLLKKAGEQHIKDFKMDSLRVLGSVGEPIAEDIWNWYNKYVGRGQAHICDTYFSTESGSHMIVPLAGITPMKPGSATLPFFGFQPAIVDPFTGEELKDNEVEGVLCMKTSWPSMVRTIWKDYNRFLDTYLRPYHGFYFTGDGAARDKDGYYWILGRVDDVVNVSGHRLSTAEIEAALLKHPLVSENAVVGYPNELTGSSIAAYVSLKTIPEDINSIKKELIMTVRREIGPFAAPKLVLLVDDLPKTRSGKIMRRILRKILAGEEDQLGDISTLSNPGVVEQLIHLVHST
ncbi:acetyl-CoA synthetase [Brettanomyces nanus]|uniref:Acetyl-coenzyme A synthetase n=1 Tax=Eeniella nana TaxID=13502 RepID=A0A875RXB6_EENNA|nr:acetyl-CoA synthetase [Brettanomyces nanus]QPG74091.1 acetyl-CoA synthetase [Brettanomyces nanus]